ncbi:MAG TPA: hypothetical protein VF776_07175 [Sphingomicrobium sp.]
MCCVVRRLLDRSAVPLGCALAALWVAPASADELKLFTADTFEISGDMRLVAVDGERSWIDGGFGKLRSGSNGKLRVRPELGNAALVWKPQFTWSLGAIVAGSVQGGDRTGAGLSQAYLTFRPMRSSWLVFSARAGLMWPPVSLEHEGYDWHVKDSITPSAINSWIGEEVRPVAAEGTVSATLGGHKLRATAALMAANDTSGTLLTFRGWALHDRTTLAFRRQPLPPLDEDVADYQAPFTHPLLDIHSGFAHRPGYYLKLAWQPPVPVRFELFHYDNRANPQDVNADSEWGWNTQFDEAGLVADLGAATELKAQALQGRTRMGFREDTSRWVDNRFRSAFVLLTRPFGTVRLTGRIDVFDTRNRGSEIGSEYNDKGWSAMLAAKRDWSHFSGLIELLHVSSRRDNRADAGLNPRQRQTQLQAEVRTHW